MYGVVYDSRNTFHKSSVSALAVGERVKFRIVVPRHFGCSYAFLCVKKDGTDYEKQGMFWAGMIDGDSEVWDITFSAAERGLYFYHFELYTVYGVRYISKAEYGKGDICEEIRDFKQTVYERDDYGKTDLEGGLVYQIFPDRFCFSGQKKNGVPSDRILREDWYGEPEHLPDENGRIKNNDYFCGDLMGIEQKLPYIKSLGVTHIYLNPIFEAHSNHRYNTANYEKIDPLLGNEKDFERLCKKAKENGISIILDGVFSHTGSDSVYFNKEGRYQSDGAYNSENSPYRSWYKIDENGNYKSWWGIETLPEVDEENDGYISYIEKITRKWMRLGAGGWRIDVADELPDKFLDSFYKTVKDENPQSPVILEVWENAGDKISYGKRRRYLLGGQADSILNYPFSNAIADFFLTGDGADFKDKIFEVVESYPEHVLNSLLTHLSNHDTERFLTKMSRVTDGEINDRTQFIMKAASMIQYSLPGVPTIYYGDEAGLDGGRDPFNRRCYPWGRENAELIEHFIKLGKVRDKIKMNVKRFIPVASEKDFICFSCESGEKKLYCAVNLSKEQKRVFVQNADCKGSLMYLDSEPEFFGNEVIIKPDSACLWLCETL